MKFHEYITKSLNTKFQWGSHDCITWAISWGSLVTDKDLLTPYGSWYDKRTAIQAIKRVGGLEKAFNESNHLKSINPNFAVDGDLMLIGRSAYLLSGEYLVGTGIGGLVFKDRTLGKKAWTYVK